MAAPALSAVGTSSEGTSGFSLAYPATVNANDIAVVFCETANNDVTFPAGWTQLASSPQSTAGAAGGTSATRLTIYWRRCDGSEDSGTIALTGSFDHLLAQMVTYSGCVTSGDPIEATAGDNTGSTSSTAVTIPGLTTSVADCRVVAAVSRMGDLAGNDRFAGWTNADLTGLVEDTEAGSAAGNGGGFAVASGVKATAGVVSATTATLLDTSRQARISFALKPATGTGGTLTGAAALSGSGTAIVAAKATRPGAATLSASGSVTGTAQRTTTGAATLAGSGTATATATRSIPASAALSGSGSATATARLSLLGSTALDGAGTLTATGSTTSGLSGAASLVGTGLLTASALVNRGAAASMQATGAISAPLSVNRAGSATLTGSGGLSALAGLETNAAVVLSGVGTLTAVGRTEIPRVATVSRPGGRSTGHRPAFQQHSRPRAVSMGRR